MAIGFIWKKQLVWYLTLLVVIVLGLGIGALLHDRFQEGDDAGTSSVNAGKPMSAGVKIATPSLPYPTTKPNVGIPTSSPPVR